MNGTRVEVIRDIETWINNSEDPQILWLLGMAGTGKTAIAWTVCSRTTEDARIIFGGSFFCSRLTGLATQRDVRCVIPTLALLLARKSPEFSSVLADELVRDPDVLHKQLNVQVEQLLYKPLSALKNCLTPIFFVIDGLDECGGQPSADGSVDDVEGRRVVSEMLEALVALARYPVKLPVKFMVTSRPETHIRDTAVSDISLSTILRLHSINKAQVEEDIRLYISTILSSNHRLSAHFKPDDADMLVRVSDGLFIVAATALKYILGAGLRGIDGATLQFKRLFNNSRDGLSIGAAAPLDKMYALILMDAANVAESEANELQEMLQFLGALLCTRMVLSVAALEEILGMEKTHLRAKLAGLHAVIHVPETDEEPSLRTLHASFGDYLFGRADNRLRIASTAGHDTLAGGCLRRLKQNDLCFNVSRSQSSFDFNPSEAPDWLALSLIYACMHWAHHIDSASNRAAFDSEIGLSLRPKFLFWLEVLSVLGKIGLASVSLRIAVSAVSHVDFKGQAATRLCYNRPKRKLFYSFSVTPAYLLRRRTSLLPRVHLTSTSLHLHLRPKTR